MNLLLVLILFTLTTHILVDFNRDSKISEWKIVNDVVMGGRSQSNFFVDSNGNGTFKGTVSLENNGGFCSVQHAVKPIALTQFKNFSIRLKGDGKKYQFRVKANRSDYFSYVYEFQTTLDWETITIPIAGMQASFRGQKVAIPNYDGSKIEEMAFLIGNSKAEQFQLLIDKIEVK